LNPPEIDGVLSDTTPSSIKKFGREKLWGGPLKTQITGKIAFKRFHDIAILQTGMNLHFFQQNSILSQGIHG
jgi:hypothetical protein